MYDYPVLTIEQPLYVRLSIKFTGEVAPRPAPIRPRYPAAPGRSLDDYVLWFFSSRPTFPRTKQAGQESYTIREQGLGETTLRKRQ